MPDPADSAFAGIAVLVTACLRTRDLADFTALVSATAHRLELRGPAQDRTDWFTSWARWGGPSRIPGRCAG